MTVKEGLDLAIRPTPQCN